MAVVPPINSAYSPSCDARLAEGKIVRHFFFNSLQLSSLPPVRCKQGAFAGFTWGPCGGHSFTAMIQFHYGPRPHEDRLCCKCFELGRVREREAGVT
jgi:hypothetical protein